MVDIASLHPPYTSTHYGIRHEGARRDTGRARKLATARVTRNGLNSSRPYLIDGRIVVTQKKTKSVVDIPIHPELSKHLPERDIWLVTQSGKPFGSVKSFQQWFVKQARMAGLEGLSAHGLRKALTAHLSEDGATPQEIAAVTGHLTLSEVSRYTEAANRKRLADSAFVKLKSI